MNIEISENGVCLTKEGIELEVKKCENHMPQSMWESYSAFANTFGGTIVLGVDERQNMKVTGINDPERVLKELWDTVNNPNKVSINLLREDDVETLTFQGRVLFLIHVPRARREVRPVHINNNLNGGTFRRNGEGDYHCTLREIKEMIRDAEDSDHDRMVLERSNLKELDADSISAFRNIMGSIRPNHPWIAYSNEDFLQVIGAAGKGQDGILHPTVAGTLMFAEEVSILQQFPHYHMDYLEFMDGPDWSDRLCTGTGMWSGNLFDFYNQVMVKLSLLNRLPLDFQGHRRKDESDLLKAEREMVLNGIVHADYYGRGGICIEVRPDMVSVRNPGMFRIPFGEAENGGLSDPRNPTLMRMFTLIGAVENAGSGVRRIMEISRANRLCAPRYEETQEPLCTTAEFILIPEDRDWSVETKIKRMMADDGTVTMDSMSERLGVSRSTVYRTVEVLKTRNEIRRVGGKRGRWEVTGYQ